MAILLARKTSNQKGGQDRTAHVGFYLIDNGLPELERLTKMRFSLFESVARFSRRFPLLIYVGSIFLLTFTAAFLC